MLTTLLMTTKSLLASPQDLPLHAPVRLMARGEYVRVENPGYAAPCWADLDGNGRKHLTVGPCPGCKLLDAKNAGEGESANRRLARAEWLEVEDACAKVSSAR